MVLVVGGNYITQDIQRFFSGGAAMKFVAKLENLFDPIRILVRLLTSFRKLVEKRLTKKTVNELVTLIFHALVILSAQWFMAILLKQMNR